MWLFILLKILVCTRWYSSIKEVGLAMLQVHMIVNLMWWHHKTDVFKR